MSDLIQQAMLATSLANICSPKNDYKKQCPDDYDLIDKDGEKVCIKKCEKNPNDWNKKRKNFYYLRNLYDNKCY